MVSLRALIGLGLFLFGCSVDPEANPGQRCGADGDCPSGRVCYREYCVLADATADVGPRDTGTVDSGQCTPGDSCVTGMPGICELGLATCGGAVACLPRTSSRAETCNDLDDDCDGQEDEGFNLLSDERHCGECNRPCGIGLDCCNGRCVNTATSALDCGECGTRCDGETCCSGLCFDTETSTVHCGNCGQRCDAGEVCCGDRCADFRTDSEYCGGCAGPACIGQDPLCCGGVCEDVNSVACQGCSEPCVGGDECCLGSCVDKTSDPSFCGACDTACGAGTPHCCNSQCVASNIDHCNGCDPCSPGQLCCSTGCVDNNAAACRDCNTVCTTGQTCCPNNVPPALACAFLQADPNNCGECGFRCGTGQDCQSGECCDPGETYCNGECRNLLEDDDNCGECGNDCTPIIIIIPRECNNGQCQ